MWGFTRKNSGDRVTRAEREIPLRPVRDIDTPTVARTVGDTEQRLRAANKQAFMTSSKGWSDALGRFRGKHK